LGFTSTFFAFLFVALALPFGQPSLWVAFEAFGEFFDVSGVSGSSFFFDASLKWLIGEGLLFLVYFTSGYGSLSFLIFFDGDVDIFFDVLKVVDIINLFRFFNPFEQLLSLCEVTLLDGNLCEFDFGVEIFWVDGKNFVENGLLFIEVLFVFVEFEENVEDFGIVGGVEEFF
jgi:hypothetical protein